jgi:hypothetical protein
VLARLDGADIKKLYEDVQRFLTKPIDKNKILMFEDIIQQHL